MTVLSVILLGLAMTTLTALVLWLMFHVRRIERRLYSSLLRDKPEDLRDWMLSLDKAIVHLADAIRSNDYTERQRHLTAAYQIAGVPFS
jgi:hypothetical protein